MKVKITNYGVVVRNKSVSDKPIIYIYNTLDSAKQNEKELRNLDSIPNREMYLSIYNELLNKISYIISEIDEKEILKYKKFYYLPKNNILLVNKYPIDVF